MPCLASGPSSGAAVRRSYVASLPSTGMKRLWSCRLACELEDAVPLRECPGLPRTPSAPQGHDGNHHPACVKGNARQQHDLPWNRADGRPRPELVSRGNRYWVNEQLAAVGDGLDGEDPAVV